jgi:hypothetical protein
MSEWSKFYSTKEIKMKYKAVNLVNHKIDVTLDNGSTFQYKTNATSVKLNKINREVCRVDAGIPLVQSIFLHEENLLPQPKKGVFYIVPKVVAEMYKNTRSDFIYPATNPRPEEDGAIITNGKITSVRKFRLPSVLSCEDEVIEMV